MNDSSTYSKFKIQIFIFGAFCLVVAFSIIQSLFTLDPHHWGLMLGNAKDLSDGLTPYKDIFIQYGIVTTVVQAAAFSVGKNLVSIIVVTSILYACGLAGLYFLAKGVLKSQSLAIYVFITLVLFHPLAIYPWANYIAFPFLVCGLYLLILRSHSRIALLLSGICFGIAVLSREGLAVPCFLLLVFSFGIDMWKGGASFRDEFFGFISSLFGFCILIGIFFAYLYVSDLFPYWHKLSLELPSMYANEIFTHMRSNPLREIIKEIYQGYRHADIRWVLVSIILIANTYILTLYVFKQERSYVNPTTAKIALATLLLLSSSLHLAEIFRIATSSAIGLINVYAILHANGRAKPFFIFFGLWLGLTATYGNRGNYFFPEKLNYKNVELVSQPAIFQGQIWPSDAVTYYQSLDGIFHHLAKSGCHLTYQYNHSNDSFLPILSPLRQMQLAPFDVSEQMEELRPDLKRWVFTHSPDKLLIIDSVSRGANSPYMQNGSHKLIARLPRPEAYFVKKDQDLLILAPLSCPEYK